LSSFNAEIGFLEIKDGVHQRDCPSVFLRLKVVSIDRSLSKGEAPRFAADFDRPLSCEGPFKFPRHLIGSLVIKGIIAMSDVIFTAPYEKKEKKLQARTRTWARTWTQTPYGHGHGYGHRHRHRR
jgi:hypothetical protein